jgi:hypothetical protein
MDEFEVEKLVYLDRDRGWQLPTHDTRDRLIDDLRSVLAPKLDDPWIDDADNVCVECYWCGANNFPTDLNHYPRPPIEHEPNCPVLRRDELLGR